MTIAPDRALRSRRTSRARRRDRSTAGPLRAGVDMNIGWCGLGTLMRHDLLPGTVTAAALGMGEAAGAAALVASRRRAARGLAGLLGAAVRTIDLAAVAAATDHHLGLAARAQEQARRAIVAAARTAGVAWTGSGIGAILPPQSCLARCGARRRTELAGCGRRRACLPVQAVFLARRVTVCQPPAHVITKVGNRRCQAPSLRVVARIPSASHGRHRQRFRMRAAPAAGPSWEYAPQPAVPSRSRPGDVTPRAMRVPPNSCTLRPPFTTVQCDPTQ